MPPIKGRPSKSPEKAAQYQRSQKRAHVKQFHAMRAIIRSAPQPPPLLGVRTDMLIVLAHSGPIRRVGLTRLFGNDRMTQLPKSDPKGLCMQWHAVYDSGKGRHGHIIAIDWNFALAQEVRDLLTVLGRDYPFRVEDEFTFAGEVPAGPGTCEIDLICGSRNRTRILAALENLGGKAPIAILEQSVPDVRPDNVHEIAKNLVGDGILQRANGVLWFTKAPWTPAYRRLLRAYLALRPQFAATSAKGAAGKRAARKERVICTLFGKAATERALLALAEDGPLTTPHLEQAVHSRLGLQGVEALVKDGLIAKVAISSDRRGNPTYAYSLNAAHPIHKPLRALLRSIAGAPANSTIADLSTPSKEWTKDHRLFGGVLSLRALLALALSEHGEMDASAIARIFPDHQQPAIAAQMNDFIDMGLVCARPWKSRRLYRLDESYPYHRELRDLLLAIAAQWPRYRESVRIEERTRPFEALKPARSRR